MEKLKMETNSPVNMNVERIGALFPNCLTEVQDDNGTIRQVIDFDKLRVELGDATVEGNRERYQFTWPQKRKAAMLANESTTMTLRPAVEESVGKDGTPGIFDSENLYIEGDNLDVLKVLRETYLGQVKMIYIDPPYNTGKDFVYKDRRYLSQEEMDKMEGRFDEYGNLLLPNTDSNGRFHTDWLNFIYPRLKVARDLLAEDGVIFISIDDGEAENMKKIATEIFGQNNFVSQVVWERAFAPINLKKHFSVSHDYILCIAKNIELLVCNGLPRTDEANSRYSNPDNDPRGIWQSDNSTVGPVVPEKVYELTSPSGKIFLPPNGRCWLYTKDRFQEMINDNRIWFGENGGNMPRVKRFLSEVKAGLTPMSIWKHEEVGHSQDASQKLKKLFNGKSYFEYPKPVGLIERCIQLYTSNDSIILDFFSGSATTAHAVMKLNAEDGGNRKFIMVQLPEVTDKDSEARKAGFETICQIGEERIRLAGAKIREDNGLQAADKDFGFRVLKLDTSNMKDMSYDPKNIQPGIFDDMTDNVKEGRGDMDLLISVMLKNNIPLSANIEKEKVNGHDVFVVNDGFMIATFDRTVDDDTIVELAKREPVKFVMREPKSNVAAGINADNIIDNFDQKFELYSPHTERQII